MSSDFYTSRKPVNVFIRVKSIILTGGGTEIKVLMQQFKFVSTKSFSTSLDYFSCWVRLCSKLSCNFSMPFVLCVDEDCIHAPVFWRGIGKVSWDISWLRLKLYISERGCRILGVTSVHNIRIWWSADSCCIRYSFSGWRYNVISFSEVNSSVFFWSFMTWIP